MIIEDVGMFELDVRLHDTFGSDYIPLLFAILNVKRGSDYEQIVVEEHYVVEDNDEMIEAAESSDY